MTDPDQLTRADYELLARAKPGLTTMLARALGKFLGLWLQFGILGGLLAAGGGLVLLVLKLVGVVMTLGYGTLVAMAVAGTVVHLFARGTLKFLAEAVSRSRDP